MAFLASSQLLGVRVGSSFPDLDLTVLGGLLVPTVGWLQPVETEIGIVELLVHL